MNKILSLTLVVLVISICNPANSHPVDALSDNQWHEIPNSKLEAVLPPITYPDYRLGNGQRSIISAWSGGAFDTKRDRLIVWGGGHGDYGGNELYVFDVNTLQWERLTDPSETIIPDYVNGQLNTEAGQTEYNVNGDGTPLSRHTYDGLQYLPNVDRFWAQGGSVWTVGHAEYLTWQFNFDTLSWERKSDTTDKMSSYSNVSAYDPVTGLVYQRGHTNLATYDPINDTWQQLSREGWMPDGMTATLDPVRRKFVMIGRGEAHMYDISVQGVSVKEPLVTAGDTEIVNCDSPGFVYDPVTTNLVAWCSGGDVYTLNLDTLIWTKHAPASDVVPVDPYLEAGGYHGTFGRFQYIPSLNAFIVATGISDNVFLYKLSDSTVAAVPAKPAKPVVEFLNK